MNYLHQIRMMKMMKSLMIFLFYVKFLVNLVLLILEMIEMILQDKNNIYNQFSDFLIQEEMILLDRNKGFKLEIYLIDLNVEMFHLARKEVYLLFLEVNRIH